MAKKQKISTRFEHFRKHLDAIAAVAVAIGTIGGALVAAGNWIISEVSAQSNQRIDQLQSEVNDHQREQQLSTTRMELMMLLEHDPDNIVEIEMLAKKYFIDLQGDFYMTNLYSSWAKAHGGDTSFVVYH